MKRTVVLLALVFAGAGTLFGDEWPAPSARSVFSDNGQYFVRITPGTPENTSDSSAKHSGRYAHGEFYARQRDRSYRLVADVALLNPVAPASAAVTDKGLLITFDNWGTAGFGKVVAMYTGKGKLIRAFTLEELYSEERISNVPHTVSSRWWRCAGGGAFGEPEKFKISEHFGGMFSFDVGKGTFEYHAGTNQCDAVGLAN